MKWLESIIFQRESEISDDEPLIVQFYANE